MLRKMIFSAVISALAVGACLLNAQDAQWKVSSKQGKAWLPELQQPFKLDAELTEWKGVPPSAIKNKSYIAHRAKDHEWNGPQDAGMDICWAWTDKGLVMAALVTDDDVLNSCEPKMFYRQDCIELFFDGRSGPEFLKQPYTTGCFQLLICPPVAGHDTRIFALHLADELVKKIEVKGKKNKDGYQIEMLIPWEMFPNFKPGIDKKLGIQFALDDYDSRDKDTNQPLMMSWNAAAQLSSSPQKFIEFTLKGHSGPSADTPLDTAVVINAPNCCTEQKAMIQVEVSSALASQMGDSAALKINNWRNEKIFEKDLNLKTFSSAGTLLISPELPLECSSLPDGIYTISVLFRDKKNDQAGLAKRHIFIIQGTDKVIKETLDKLEAAKLPELSRKEPFRADAYLGVVSAVEWLKMGIEQKQPGPIINAIAEIKARLAVLEGAPLEDANSLLGLLELSRNPDSQVTAEFSRGNGMDYPRRASVAIYWGSFPLVSAFVTEYESENDARQLSKKETLAVSETITLKGFPCSIYRSANWSAISQLDFNPEKEVYSIEPKQTSRYCIVLPLENMDSFNAKNIKAVSFFSQCPEKLKETLEKWAEKSKIPIVSPDKINSFERVAVGGRPDESKFGQSVRKLSAWRIEPLKQKGSLFCLKGRKTIWIESVSKEAACLFAEMILNEKPLTPQDADTFRKTLLASLPYKSEKLALPEGNNLFCGDVHMHSFYSDGRPSPVGLLAEAFYCFMDFSVLTDHNTIDGAVLAKHLADKFNFRHCIVVGEEITTSYAHMNAYPLKEAVSWKIPDCEAVKAAHSQGAVIQWNHPEVGRFSQWDERLRNGIQNTGFDAWEHYPGKYEQWKKEGKLPTIVGSTDTHSGTFSYLERTVLLSPSLSGEGIAEAVRNGSAAMINASQVNYVYGNDRMIQFTVNALADAEYLKTMKKKLISDSLRNVNIKDLIISSPAKALKQNEPGKKVNRK